MKTEHIEAANAAVETAREKLVDMASINRQQADAADLAAHVFSTLMTGTLTPEARKDIADLAAKFSRQQEPEKPDYTGGRRPVPARTAANGAAAQEAAE